MDFTTGNLARQFKQRCGRGLIDEVQAYLQHEGRLNYGKVAVTSAYNLKAKALYHIALKRTDQPGYERVNNSNTILWIIKFILCCFFFRVLENL